MQVFKVKFKVKSFSCIFYLVIIALAGLSACGQHPPVNSETKWFWDNNPDNDDVYTLEQTTLQSKSFDMDLQGLKGVEILDFSNITVSYAENIDKATVRIGIRVDPTEQAQLQILENVSQEQTQGGWVSFKHDSQLNACMQISINGAITGFKGACWDISVTLPQHATVEVWDAEKAHTKIFHAMTMDRLLARVESARFSDKNTVLDLFLGSQKNLACFQMTQEDFQIILSKFSFIGTKMDALKTLNRYVEHFESLPEMIENMFTFDDEKTEAYQFILNNRPAAAKNCKS